MRYRIDFRGKRRSMVVNSRKDLLDWLKLLHPNTIEDIRKLYKSGASDSVLEIYMPYIWQEERRFEAVERFKTSICPADKTV